MSQPPVLLMHGVGSSFDHNWVRSGWAEALQSEGRTVVAGHLPGHGPEATDEGAGGGIVESVLESIDGIPRVDAVGFSAGSYGVLSTLVRHPERFRRVALLAIGDRMTKNDLGPRLELADALVGANGAREADARVIRRVIENAGNDVHLVARHISTPRPSVTVEHLEALRCPVLIVLGERDYIGPPTDLQTAIPDCEVVVVDGVGHNGVVTSRRAKDAVFAFLGRDD